MIVTEKIWLSEREAVEYCSLSRAVLSKDRENGKITYRLKGSKIIYHKDDLDAYIEKNTDKYVSSDEFLKKKNKKTPIVKSVIVKSVKSGKPYTGLPDFTGKE